MKKSIAARLLFLFLCSFLLGAATEATVCNFRFFESLTFSNQIYISNEQLVLGAGLAAENDGQIVVRSDNQQTIEFDAGHRDIHNLKLMIHQIEYLNVKISVQDDGNSQMVYMGDQFVTSLSESSYYFRLHPYGNVNRIKLEFNLPVGTSFFLESISLNVPRPFNFSILRFAGLFCIFFTFMLVRNKEICSINFDRHSKIQKLVLLLLVLVHIAVCAGGNSLSDKNRMNRTDSDYEYQYLAHSLSEGKVELSITASDEMLELENPYDLFERERNGVNSYWDFAYFEGNYYVYFGVIPVLLMYLPYYFITGMDLPNYIPQLIAMSLSIAGITLLFYEIVSQKFKKMSFVLFCILETLLVHSMYLVFLTRRTDIYSIPILFSLMFSSFGLYYWIKSKASGNLNRRSAVFGSFLIALTLGCRPQFMMSAFLAFPIFWDEVKQLYKKENLISFSLALIPFFLVGAGIMFYNNLRFDSFFDFGANYNLTTNDMNYRGFHLDRIPYGLFRYLFQPMNMNFFFPFIQNTYSGTNYLGVTIMEDMYGGIFAVHPWLSSLFFLFHLKDDLKERKLWGISCGMIASALIILIADIQMAGILTRYYCDFSLFLALPAALGLCCLAERHRQNLGNILAVLSLITVGFSVLSLFTGGSQLLQTNPGLYYWFGHCFSFWI